MINLTPDYKYNRDLFHVEIDDKIGENWFICFQTGNDSLDGHDYAVATNHLHGDEIPEEVMLASDTAELIAKLLNFYHRGWLFVGDPDQLELFNMREPGGGCSL